MNHPWVLSTHISIRDYHVRLNGPITSSALTKYGSSSAYTFEPFCVHLIHPYQTSCPGLHRLHIRHFSCPRITYFLERATVHSTAIPLSGVNLLRRGPWFSLKHLVLYAEISYIVFLPIQWHINLILTLPFQLNSVQISSHLPEHSTRRFYVVCTYSNWPIC